MREGKDERWRRGASEGNKDRRGGGGGEGGRSENKQSQRASEQDKRRSGRQIIRREIGRESKGWCWWGADMRASRGRGSKPGYPCRYVGYLPAPEPEGRKGEAGRKRPWAWGRGQ